MVGVVNGWAGNGAGVVRGVENWGASLVNEAGRRITGGGAIGPDRGTGTSTGDAGMRLNGGRDDGAGVSSRAIGGSAARAGTTDGGSGVPMADAVRAGIASDGIGGSVLPSKWSGGNRVASTAG